MLVGCVIVFVINRLLKTSRIASNLNYQSSTLGIYIQITLLYFWRGDRCSWLWNRYFNILFYLVQFATQPDFRCKAKGIWTAFNSWWKKYVCTRSVKVRSLTVFAGMQKWINKKILLEHFLLYLKIKEYKFSFIMQWVYFCMWYPLCYCPCLILKIRFRRKMQTENMIQERRKNIIYVLAVTSHIIISWLCFS